MSLFDNQDDQYEDEMYESRHRSKIGSFFAKLLVFFIAIPAVIVGALHFWFLFAQGRLRISVISIITFFELLIIIPIVKATHPITNLINAVTFSGDVTMSSFIISYIALFSVIGIIGAYILDIWKARQFKNTPYLLSMDGWSYKFTYRDTPWEILRRKMIKKALIDGKYYDESSSPLGIREEPTSYQTEEIDEDKAHLQKNEAEVVSRSYKAALKHTLITGETGSGKTVTMLSLMYNDIKNGFPVCVIDFKKSPDVLYFLSKWAKDFDRDFYYFSNGDLSDNGNEFYDTKSTYDPFLGGDQSSLTDTIVSLRQWDTASDVYRSRTESLLTALFFGLLNVDHDDVPNIPWSAGGLNQIIAAMDLKNMYDMIRALDKKYAAGKLINTDIQRLATLKEIYESLRKNSSEGKVLKEQLEGIKLICNKLILSSYGHWLAKGNSKKHIDLLQISTSKKGPIVLFGLSQMEESEFAKSMGAIILGDLKRTSSTKNEMNNDVPFGVYIDEFQTIDPNDASDLLEKSRSAGFFCTLASQSLEKISAASPINGEATLKSVLDTCGNYIFHSGAQQDSAERMSKILGQTRHVSRSSSTKINNGLLSLNLFNQRLGVIKKDVTVDYIIPPSKFQSLSAPLESNGYKSEAYFISSVPAEKNRKISIFGAQRVQVIAQTEITDGIPIEFRNFIGNAAELRHERQTGVNIKNIISDNVEPPVDETMNDIMGEFSSKKRTPEIINDNEWEIEEISEEQSPNEPVIMNKPEQTVKTAPKPQATVSNQQKKEKPTPLETTRPLTSFERMKLAEKEKKSSAKRNENKKNEKTKTDSFKLPKL